MLIIQLLEGPLQLVWLFEAPERLLLVLHELKQEHLEDRGHVAALSHVLLVLHLALLLLVLLYCLRTILLVQGLLQLLGVIDVSGVDSVYKLHLHEKILKILSQLAVIVLRAQLQARRRALKKLLLKSSCALRQYIAH